MDPVTRREVLDMISASKAPERVIVLTSHAMEEVEMLADKVVVMAHGQIQVRFGAFGK
jgi:ABC-type multidrug transport system ATPase subunit